MAEDKVVRRLKRAQANLLKVCAETIALRAQAEANAMRRQLSEWQERRRISRQRRPIFPPKSDRLRRA